MNDHQQWDPQRYLERARFVPELGMLVLELLAPRAGERVLDLGCGDGLLGRELADRGCSVVGVDASPEMVAAARARGLDARVMRAEALDFEDEFDAQTFAAPLPPASRAAFLQEAQDACRARLADAAGISSSCVKCILMRRGACCSSKWQRTASRTWLWRLLMSSASA